MAESDIGLWKVISAKSNMKRKLLQLDLTSTEFDSRSNWLRFDSKRKGIFVKWGHVNPWKSAVNLSLIWQEEDFLRLQWGLPSGMRTHPPNSSSTFYWLLFQILLFTAKEFNLPLPGNYIVRETHLPNSSTDSSSLEVVSSLHHMLWNCKENTSAQFLFHLLLTPLP